MRNLTHHRLSLVLDYSPDTGEFIWVKSIKGVKSGDTAGSLQKSGHRIIKIDGGRYYAHRLAWFYMTGEWPVKQIDHKNRVPDDNRFCNLRLASHTENMNNRGPSIVNSTGIKGVSIDRRTGKFRARIRNGIKRVNLGCFDTREGAHSAYLAAARIWHGEFGGPPMGAPPQPGPPQPPPGMMR